MMTDSYEHATSQKPVVRHDSRPAVRSLRGPKLNPDNLDNLVDERMREVQGYISGTRPINADRICLLIEFCYLLNLHQQAVELHRRLDRNEMDADWLRRVDTIVRVSGMKL